jgi:hypothetical protein
MQGVAELLFHLISVDCNSETSLADCFVHAKIVTLCNGGISTRSTRRQISPQALLARSAANGVTELRATSRAGRDGAT